jgi:hypothetical protein
LIWSFMRSLNKVKQISAAVAFSSLLALQARATIAYNYPGDLAANAFNAGDVSLGMVFTVNSPITITQIGAYDDHADGVFLKPLDVAIYRVTIGGLSGHEILSGTLAVGPTTFSTAVPGTLLAGTQTRLQNILDVSLAVGTYMVVANHYGGPGGTGENHYNRNYDVPGLNAPSANTGGGAVSFGENYTFNTVFVPDPTWIDPLPLFWTYDTFNDPASPGTSFKPRYTAGNFDFAVPEASEFALAGVGLLGLVYVGRCYKLRPKHA